VPFKVGGNQQLVAIPPVNDQLHLRRWVRVLQDTGPRAITLDIIRVNTLATLGISLISGSTATYAVHSARFFSVENTADVNPFMKIILRDIEETGSPKVGEFTAASTIAGVSHVQVAHPVNNRPTFSNTTTGTLVYCDIQGVGTAARVVMDLEMTIVITS